MPYSTVAQVRVKLKDYEKREIADDILNNAIAEADSIIDSYLCKYYNTAGFSSSIGIINTLSKCLAASYATGTLHQDWDQSASTWESKLRNWAINQLHLIQDGTMNVPGLDRINV